MLLEYIYNFRVCSESFKFIFDHRILVLSRSISLGAVITLWSLPFINISKNVFLISDIKIYWILSSSIRALTCPSSMISNRFHSSRKLSNVAQLSLLLPNLIFLVKSLLHISVCSVIYGNNFDLLRNILETFLRCIHNIPQEMSKSTVQNISFIYRNWWCNIKNEDEFENSVISQKLVPSLFRRFVRDWLNQTNLGRCWTKKYIVLFTPKDPFSIKK